MGNWKRLSLVTTQALDIYRRMEVPDLKSSAGPDIIFENLRKEAVLGAIMVVRTLFEQIGLKVKYRGLENLRGRRVAFVANHQGGNLDALVIASILFSEQERTPFIPTSNRLLEAQVIGKFSEYLKYIGPFFIKTSFAGDTEYIAQVLKFMDAVLDAKQYLLFFLEGDTSRGGKPRPPRRGLIKSLTHAPLVFCPISITYESSLNDTGIKSKAFHVQDAVANLTRRQVGTCYVTFGECLDSEPGHCHKGITDRLSTAIYSEIPILTVDVIATILLDRGSLSLKELKTEVSDLEHFIRDRKLPLISKDVEKALPAIDHLVSVEGGRCSIQNAIVLNFYRNRALHAFFDLANPPPFLKYECCWSPPQMLGNERIRTLAVRAVAPLIEAYRTVMSRIGPGTTKEVLAKLLYPNPTTSCCTLDNILQLLTETGLIRVQGHDVIPLVRS
jgi:1-acyl-sn-glycerol-3-phosphate acyltransferase